MAETLYSLPSEFPAGTTVTYRRQTSDYPATDGWTLTLYLAGPTEISSEAVADGADHVFTLTAEETAVAPGVYEWIEQAAKGDEVFRVASGALTVLTNLSAATGGSNQQWLERAIGALQAHIEGRMPSGMQSYQIAGRVVSKMSLTEALGVLSTLEARLARVKNPKRVTRPVLVRFTGTGLTQ